MESNASLKEELAGVELSVEGSFDNELSAKGCDETEAFGMPLGLPQENLRGRMRMRKKIMMRMMWK